MCFTLLLVLTTSVQASDMDAASAENAYLHGWTVVAQCRSNCRGAIFAPEGFYLSSSDVQGQISNNQVYNSFSFTGKNIR